MSAHRSSHYIFWDLDGTLGHFERISYPNREAIPSMERPLAIRPGIKELLQELSHEGFAHYVTTAASIRYATTALKSTGLFDSITGIYGHETVGYGLIGKHYRPVTSILGLPDEEIQAHGIVIGDSMADKPNDIDGLVFLELGTENSLEALVIREIFTKLMDAGDGDFKRGFEALHKRAARTLLTLVKNPKSRKYSLGNGIEFELCYRDHFSSADSGRQEVPVITNIVTKQHEKEWTPIS